MNGFKALCIARGIKLQMSAPETPCQNGISEQKWNTLARMMRRMLFDAKLPPSYWTFALQHAVAINNRVSTTALDLSLIHI